MLTLSRKQMTVLFLVLVSFIVALAVSAMIIHSTSPDMWQHVDGLLPNVMSHF